jgi:hypothetical protein
VRYRITHFSTVANFLLTKNDDKLSLLIQDENVTPLNIFFPDCSNWENLEFLLNKLLENSPQDFNLKFTKNQTWTFSLSCNFEFKITEVSHRVSLLLGLYHCEITSQKPLEAVCQQNETYRIEFPSVPLVCFGNIMYLMSKHVNAVGANDSETDLKLSIAYKYGDFLYPAIPCVSRREGYWIYCLPEDLGDVEFQLADFQFHPIIIKNPIHLSIQVEFGGDVF